MEGPAMTYTDLIFDLYGTLVDIHTEESDAVWEKRPPSTLVSTAPTTPVRS